MKIFVFASTYASLNSYRPEAETFMGLARLGHEVTVMTKANPEQVSRYQSAGVRVIEGEPKKKICIESIKKIRKELSENDYDIVYATNSKTIPNAGFACIGFKVKLVVYRGTTGGLYRHDPTAYLTILHPRVDGVVCVSNAVKEDVRQRVWKKKDQVVTIYKGHNIQWYQDVVSADLSEFNIPKESFTVICAVNARPSKGISVMLEAANLLADLPNLQLLLVGRNMDKKPYSDLIANSKMRDRIHLTGYRHDVPELVKASSVLVQPSISGEGLPRAVMEAMGLGTPVVITTTGGGKEVVDNEKSGFVVPVKSPQAIAEKVRYLYHHPEIVQMMTQRSEEKIRGELSAENTAVNYAQYFKKLILND
ncbi:glycosyltransferase family 4 protein [Aliikangiella coralliicola]|uniref:Glycosyltransferase family 4 protein n=1 Tax=Aliikangiella coralliicola TaxID=2592383 RepID=A0A545TW32_9GAMM|nr:glycosyltransferase family 4 protein [Aliikangiella coralliicola]TQV81426.1 glycosyltransferase family 4 protein [Aliikangiella coralliicola]